MRDSYALSCVRGTLGTEQRVLGVRVCYCAYVYRNVVADNRNYNHKLVRANNRTKNNHMPVLVLNVVVAHNVRDQAYPMKASTE